MPHVEPLREGDPSAVGPYRLVGRLGAGGQGVVYLGQARNGQPVAVKVLRDDLAGESRFAETIAAARRVEPLNVAQIVDASLTGRPYLVSEYVDGPPLRRAGRHTGAELQRLAVGAATALAAVHRAGLAHGDFTPDAVLLGPGGPRVIGYGLGETRVTAASGIAGIPAYMAPERLAGQESDQAADVFSWGCVVVFAATGAPPFGDDALPAVIDRIMHGEPVLGDLPQPLRTIVQGCLAKDPALRPDMRQVMLQLLGGDDQPLLPQKGKPVRRGRRAVRRALIAGVSGVLVIALAGAIVWLTPSDPAQPVAGRKPQGLASATPAAVATTTAPPRSVRILSVRARSAAGTPSPSASPSADSDAASASPSAARASRVRRWSAASWRGRPRR